MCAWVLFLSCIPLPPPSLLNYVCVVCALVCVYKREREGRKRKGCARLSSPLKWWLPDGYFCLVLSSFVCIYVCVSVVSHFCACLSRLRASLSLCSKMVRGWKLVSFFPVWECMNNALCWMEIYTTETKTLDGKKHRSTQHSKIFETTVYLIHDVHTSSLKKKDLYRPYNPLTLFHLVLVARRHQMLKLATVS